MKEEEIEIIVKKDGKYHNFFYKKGEKYKVYKQTITDPLDMSDFYIVSSPSSGMSMWMMRYIYKDDCLSLSELREVKLGRVLKND